VRSIPGIATGVHYLAGNLRADGDPNLAVLERFDQRSAQFEVLLTPGETR